MRAKISTIIKLFFAVAASIMFVFGAANYQGFCIEKMRYLSDEEKLNSAMRYFARIESNSHCEKHAGINPLSEKIICTVPYGSLSEFEKHNP